MERVLDWVFLVGVFLKGLDGLVELVAGVVLLVVSPAELGSLAHRATANELAEDPHDLIANLIVHGAAHLTRSTSVIAAIYLIVHGAVKLVIFVALLRGSRRVYPWAVGALTILLAVQIVDLVVRPSVGVALLSVLDLAIIWLTIREWRHGRTLGDVLRLRAPWLARLGGRPGSPQTRG
mgnify:CR=1 FL=1